MTPEQAGPGTIFLNVSGTTAVQAKVTALVVSTERVTNIVHNLFAKAAYVFPSNVSTYNARYMLSRSVVREAFVTNRWPHTSQHTLPITYTLNTLITVPLNPPTRHLRPTSGALGSDVDVHTMGRAIVVLSGR